VKQENKSIDKSSHGENFPPKHSFGNDLFNTLKHQIHIILPKAGIFKFSKQQQIITTQGVFERK